ncbi:DUF1003 domain-containing protein [Sphingorhabdus contaminans]|jgi:uncharacterized membrane protein|uniref:DUF1003 domain-containing protein n=1 Tax=Sphingorhabdus contaminans TaxID=1343899 RepID=A0A553W9R7_9SPHN|nr:DUF1003 domain-containing protein [Sphingorhabdus contaminans]TSB01423.1 DUF1003 domain-containing protein [Sphingorhabdus contaminans]
MTTPRTVDDLALELLGKSSDALSAAERRVLERIHKRETTQDIGVVHEESATFGERLSDHVAAVGGSWGFIIAFTIVLFGWMILNSQILNRLGMAFDPYPFIFLNLMLSTLAAVQAPIIMMSQNRQADKDRNAAAHDYEVNLRAELEILRLHEKVNHLIEQVSALKRPDEEQPR